MYIHEKEKAKMTDYIRNMINSLAEDILDIYKIGFRVDDINDLVQKLGGSIQMKKDFSYASLEKNGDGFKIIVSSYQDEQRKRFAIAQELGHLFLHMGYKTNAEIWEKQADKVPFQEKDPEKVRQANEFAAALLMPAIYFFPYFGSSVGHCRIWKKNYSYAGSGGLLQCVAECGIYSSQRFWDYLKELIMRCRKTSGFSMVI